MVPLLHNGTWNCTCTNESACTSKWALLTQSSRFVDRLPALCESVNASSLKILPPSNNSWSNPPSLQYVRQKMHYLRATPWRQPLPRSLPGLSKKQKTIKEPYRMYAIRHLLYVRVKVGRFHFLEILKGAKKAAPFFFCGLNLSPSTHWRPK